MASSEVTIAVEAFRKAFERVDALGVNVKAAAPALPGPTSPYVIQMRDLVFEERGTTVESALKQMAETRRSTSI